MRPSAQTTTKLDQDAQQADAVRLAAELARCTDQRESARYLRNLVIDTMKATSGRGVVVYGQTVFHFDTPSAKQTHVDQLSRGAWGSDTDLRVLAALFRVGVVVHPKNAPSDNFSISYDLSYESQDAAPLSSVGAEQKKAVLHVVNSQNIHWEAAVTEGDTTIPVTTPGDGNCAFHAFRIGLQLAGLLNADSQTSTDSTVLARERSFVSGDDSLLISRRTEKANVDLAAMLCSGLTFGALRDIATKLAAHIEKNTGQTDDFLEGHIKTAADSQELAERVAARVGVDGYTAEKLSELLKTQSAKPLTYRTGPALFSPQKADTTDHQQAANALKA